MDNVFGQDALAILSPYLISFALSVVIGLYAWRRKQVAGSKEFALYTFASASITLFFITELLSGTLVEKVFWDNWQYVGMLVSPIIFIEFVQSYSGARLALPRFARMLIFAIPVLLILLMYTDPLHGLFRPDVELLPGEPFSALTYSFTPLFWAIVIFVYALMLVGVVYLVRMLTQPHQIYRRQVATILLGILVVLFTAILPIIGVVQVFQRDITPIGLLACNLIIAWGLFRYHLLKAMPVAYHAVVHSNPDAVIILDQHARIVDMNPAALRMTGKKLSEVLGYPGKEVFAAIPEMISHLEDASETHDEMTMLLNGETSLLDLRMSILNDDLGHTRGWTLVARDITTLKQSEADLKQRTAQLEQANRKLEATNTRLHVLSRAKDEFVSNVSHELRTPISNLKLYIDLIRIRPENQSRYLETLERETSRLEGMIESLLMLSRLDQDRVSFRYQSVDLNALVEEYVMDRGQLADSKGLRLEKQATPGLPRVRADRSLIGQVLSILLTNALHYTPEGGIVTVITQSRQREGQNWVGISVKDTGRGIPEEEQKQLFTRFFRGSAAREAEVAGTGLGLAISKEIITRHQGSIEVSSRGVPGMGTQFDVWLPAEFILEEP